MAAKANKTANPNERVTVATYIKQVREAVHSPRYNDHPIYGKVQSASGTQIAQEITWNDPAWTQYTQKTNTSPSNIRRVIIGPTAVIVEHFEPISGVKGLVRVESVPLPENRLTPQDMISMLKCFSHPWVCANLEEVIVDTTLCPDIVPNIAEAFIRANSEDTKDFYNRYPLLRSIIALPQAVKIGKQLLELRHRTVQALAQKITNRELQADPLAKYKLDATTIIATLPELESALGNGAKKLFREFPGTRASLRRGDYIYDSRLKLPENLAKAGDQIKLERGAEEVSQRYGDEGEERTEKSVIEKYLDEFEKKDPSLIELVFFNLKTETKLDILQQFSTKGYKHYAEILKLGGDEQ